VSAKYPRSFHLPWSPGGTNDDKRLADVSPLVGVEIVVTEKCDGSNLTYTRKNVFSRSHSGPPSHPSFDLAKATHARIGHLLSEGLSLFCEFCYAIHSIEYAALPDYSLVFGARDDWGGNRATFVVGVVRNSVVGVSMVDSRGYESGVALLPGPGGLWSFAGGYGSTNLVVRARLASGQIVAERGVG